MLAGNGGLWGLVKITTQERVTEPNHGNCVYEREREREREEDNYTGESNRAKPWYVFLSSDPTNIIILSRPVGGEFWPSGVDSQDLPGPD
jgi:hypothetical protein